MGLRLAPFALATLFATSLATPAASQSVLAPCRLCSVDPAKQGSGNETAVRLDVETTLDFDRLILSGSGAGMAELGPDGARSVGGSIQAIGARAMVGQVVIRGEPGRHVRIGLPDQIVLHGLSGGTIQLESIRTDLIAAPRLGANGTLTFRFGGILKIDGDSDGEFRGDVPIDVEYF